MSNPNGAPKRSTCLRGHDTTEPESRGTSGQCLACAREKMATMREKNKRVDQIVAEYDPKSKVQKSSVELEDEREMRRQERLEAREARRLAREGASDAR